jgi:hypothetical protein
MEGYTKHSKKREDIEEEHLREDTGWRKLCHKMTNPGG